MSGPPGKDARERAAIRAAQEREDRAESIRLYGPDPGELEPCGWCGQAICDPSRCPADPANR